ncbi:mechanosensitive ion channel family protein [Chloroflexota bacterium]
MQPDFIKGSLLLEIGWAAGILVVATLFAWFFRWLLRHIQHRAEEQGQKNSFFPTMLKPVIYPVFLLIVTEGLLLALSSLSYLAPWGNILTKSRIAVVIVVFTYTIATGTGALLSWYLRKASIRHKAKFDEGLIRFLRRSLLLIVLAIGILVLLDYLNISITPIIAGLGIGGLAVALALQPTLGNFFAGTQIISDRLVKVGDYIELENAEIKGYVMDVGWRSTRIRTPFNNMIIIPNSRLADSIITNYFGPSMEIGVIIEAGVSYNSDLNQVEEITRSVAKQVVDELDEADKAFDAWFGFHEFADSNINFWVWVRAMDRTASFKVKSEIMKRLKTRFDEAGITINYPQRQLSFDEKSLPPAFRSGRPDSGSED